ncbi:hypothetical protein E8E12_010084 [Didymella heteroderae]|uniref:AB hydrolase-1 domain-containing protein n=1 Tax=Didymella heteroderae TaxID=1769908 RepID=A0A9P4WWM7_9PLEO|nr:hypothetical protein E8E12_010084 [Didymella heteroderae]
MIALLVSASWLMYSTIIATPVHLNQRLNGYCVQLDLPMSAIAPSAIYNLPQVNSNIDATAWAIYDATWTKPHGAQSIVKNTTTSGIFNIHAHLCIPKRARKEDMLQIATHGVHYDSRYWDSAYKPEEHSYVEATLKAGYSILTYDRLGTGQSDHPDAYSVVQAPLELEILRQLTLLARNGTLYEHAAKTDGAVSPFHKLTKPSKIIHIGHSFGSILTSAFIANYGNLTDGAIITGYYLSELLGSAGSTTFGVEYAAAGSPAYNRSSGYVVCQRSGIHNIFFGGDSESAYTPALLDYGVEIKQPVPIGELASAFLLVGIYGPSFTAPVQYLLPEFDFYICRGDCKGVANMTLLEQTYPNASAIEVVIQPNTGHALPLHNNATAGFQLIYDFLDRHGL